MARRNRTETVRVPLSLDLTTDNVLKRLAEIGIFGKNKAEVAVTILRHWLWDNEEKLTRQNVQLTGVKKGRS
jgi:hypothetical protein